MLVHPNIYAYTQLRSYTHIYFPCMISYSLTYDFIHVYAGVCMPMYYILNLCLLFHVQTYIFLITISFHIILSTLTMSYYMLIFHYHILKYFIREMHVFQTSIHIIVTCFPINIVTYTITFLLSHMHQCYANS